MKRVRGAWLYRGSPEPGRYVAGVTFAAQNDSRPPAGGCHEENKMKKMLTSAAILTLLAAPAMAQAKSCEELKSEIEAKIRQNGVTEFTLTVVDKDAAEDGKVVGTCGGGTKKIVYKRG
jgi:hypothetical protein